MITIGHLILGIFSIILVGYLIFNLINVLNRKWIGSFNDVLAHITLMMTILIIMSTIIYFLGSIIFKYWNVPIQNLNHYLNNKINMKATIILFRLITIFFIYRVGVTCLEDKSFFLYLITICLVILYVKLPKLLIKKPMYK